jgi:hypothetical protein
VLLSWRMRVMRQLTILFASLGEANKLIFA